MQTVSTQDQRQRIDEAVRGLVMLADMQLRLAKDLERVLGEGPPASQRRSKATRSRQSR